MSIESKKAHLRKTQGYKEPTITHTHNSAIWWDDNPNTAGTKPYKIAEMCPVPGKGYGWKVYSRAGVNETESSGIIGHHTDRRFSKFYLAACMITDTIRAMGHVEGIEVITSTPGIALDDRANVDNESENRRLGNILGAAMELNPPWECGECNYLGLESEEELEKPIEKQKDCESCGGRGWERYSDSDAA